MENKGEANNGSIRMKSLRALTSSSTEHPRVSADFFRLPDLGTFTCLAFRGLSSRTEAFSNLPITKSTLCLWSGNMHSNLTDLHAVVLSTSQKHMVRPVTKVLKIRPLLLFPVRLAMEIARCLRGDTMFPTGNKGG